MQWTKIRLVSAFERIAGDRPLPKIITVDNGPEFTSRVFDEWTYRREIQLDFIRPGKPVKNGLIESFNGRLRKECPNVREFTTLEDARQKTETWRQDNNHHRPHGSLGNLTPIEYLKTGQADRKKATDSNEELFKNGTVSDAFALTFHLVQVSGSGHLN